MFGRSPAERLLPFQVTSELDADSIERIESGDLEPTAAMIRIIARGLHLPPLWLTDGLDPHTIAGLRAEAAKAGAALAEGRFSEARDRYAALLRQPPLGTGPRPLAAGRARPGPTRPNAKATSPR